MMTLEAEEMYLKNFFRLLDKLYFDLVGKQFAPNGKILLKSIISHLVEVFTLPKLTLKLQVRCTYMLDQVITMSNNALIRQKKEEVDHNSRCQLFEYTGSADKGLIQNLTDACLQMLDPKTAL